MFIFLVFFIYYFLFWIYFPFILFLFILVKVMGPQQPVPTLPPAETKSRFQRVLIAFLQVFLARFPAILFLDDIFLLFHLLLYINFILFSKYMQWADPATISLVESLATDTTINNLILICAYRYFYHYWSLKSRLINL